MKIGRIASIGATFALLTAALLSAGCSQSVGTETGISTPTPTATFTPIPSTTMATVITTGATSSPTVSATPIRNVIRNVTAQKAELAELAETFARQINVTTLDLAASEGQNSTAFSTILTQLRAFKSSDPELVYVYTLDQQNGTVRFVVDADYGMPGGSGFMEPYPDAPAELTKPVTSPIGAGPYTDSYGTFISGYAPVGAPINGTSFILGVDSKA